MSEKWQEIERFRSLVIELDLPRREVAVCSLKCPYCGKSDRVHKLETPSELEGAPEEYLRLWDRYGAGAGLVVCKFCHQLLRFSEEEGRLSPLVDAGEPV